MPALVRVESGAPLRIGRVLDHGAAGVMIPRVRSAAEAAQAVAYARYPPSGVRGVALSARGAGFGTAVADGVGLIDASDHDADPDRERGGALLEAEAIAAVDGVDVLFVGPNDLSHSLAIAGRFDDPRYLDALAAVGGGGAGGGQGRRRHAALAR